MVQLELLSSTDEHPTFSPNDEAAKLHVPEIVVFIYLYFFLTFMWMFLTLVLDIAVTFLMLRA